MVASPSTTGTSISWNPPGVLGCTATTRVDSTETQNRGTCSATRGATRGTWLWGPTSREQKMPNEHLYGRGGRSDSAQCLPSKCRGVLGCRTWLACCLLILQPWCPLLTWFLRL